MKKECELSLIVRGRFDAADAEELLKYAAAHKKRKGVKTSVRLLMEAFLPSTPSEDVSFELRRESE